MTRLKWREFAMKPADPGEYEVTRHDKTFLWIRVSDRPWGEVAVAESAEPVVDKVVDPAPAEPVAGPEPAADPTPVPEVKVDGAAVEPEIAPVVEAPRELADARLNLLIAMGRRARETEMGRGEPEPGPAGDGMAPDPGSEAVAAEPTGPYFGMTRQQWKWMGTDKQPRWLTSHGLTFGEGDEDKYGEWLEGMPR